MSKIDVFFIVSFVSFKAAVKRGNFTCLTLFESSVYFRSIDKLNDFYQNCATSESSIGFENLACLQSIEKRCKQPVHKAKLNIFITYLLA